MPKKTANSGNNTQNTPAPSPLANISEPTTVQTTVTKSGEKGSSNRGGKQ